MLFIFYPQMQSMSVVPVGLTKFREGLYPLEPFEREEAREVLATIHKWQDISFEKYGTHFVQASDEWYLIAGYDLPTEERYDGYTQLENGVGMIRLLMDEFREALAKEKSILLCGKKECAIATGRLAAPFIRMLCQEFMEKFPKVTVHVYEIRNDFFGEKDHGFWSDHRTGSDGTTQGTAAGKPPALTAEYGACRGTGFLG